MDEEYCVACGREETKKTPGAIIPADAISHTCEKRPETSTHTIGWKFGNNFIDARPKPPKED